MRPKARRARSAQRLELLELEPRALLSGVFVGPFPFTPPAAEATASVLVRFAANEPAGAIRADLGAVDGSVVESFADGPTWVALGPGVDRETALQELRTDPNVVYAEADATFHASSVIPNDPFFGSQWGLSSPNNVDIDAPEAWSVTIGSPSTIVAVLDTGIDQYSPDFAGKLWNNPNPYGDPGFSRDFHGWNFVNNNNNIQDNNGHGTHVSGIAAAWSNNNSGISGIDWNAQIMPVKVLDSQGNGSTDAAVAGIYYAVNHGARVLNASWGGGDYSQAMIDALNYANSRNVVFVTAAGNNGTNNDSTPSYPASYRLPNEISVAAIDPAGNLASFSNFGVNTVDIAAPGVGILSTIPGTNGPGPNLAAYSGTSMATPFVTGTVSLLIGLHPDWSATQLVHQVLSTAKPLAGLTGRVVTGGIVDAYNAVTGKTGGISAAQSPVQLNASTNSDVLASILATDAYYGSQGGTNAGFVNGISQVVLGRAPDAGTFSYFYGLLQQGQSRFNVAQALANTPEAHAVEVARWYQSFFGGASVPLWQLEQDPGLRYWSGFAASYGENTALAGILATDAYWNSQGGTNAGFVNGISQVVLGRPPDPGTFAYFAGLLQQGQSRFNVVRALQGTLEARCTTVAQWYQSFFGDAQPLWQVKSDPAVLNWAAFLSAV